MVHHRRRDRIVAVGVSAEALFPKCDTDERADEAASGVDYDRK